MLTSPSKLDHFRKMLGNERSFDGLFSDELRLNGATFFYNEHFQGDLVFNHAVINEELLHKKSDPGMVQDTIQSVQNRARSLALPDALFVENFWEGASRFEQSAIDFGFRIAERMHLLAKKPNQTKRSDSSIEVFETKNARLWNELFVKSYAIPPAWDEELLKREEAIVQRRDANLILAKEKGSDLEASGCLLIHRFPTNYLGIYCVGTLKERRARGVARAMLEYAEVVALQEACEYLTLQTLASEAVTPMYLKLGYKLEFERDVLASV